MLIADVKVALLCSRTADGVSGTNDVTVSVRRQRHRSNAMDSLKYPFCGSPRQLPGLLAYSQLLIAYIFFSPEQSLVFPAFYRSPFFWF